MAMLEEHKHEKPVHDFDGITENRVNPPPVYFTVLFYGLIIWGAIFCAYYLLSGWSSDAEFQQKKAAWEEQKTTAQAPAAAPEHSAEERLAAGKKLYAAHCAACHGAGGKGGIGPDLTATQLKYGRTPEAVLASIREGRPDGMPAFGNQLSADQTQELIDFLLSLK